MANQISSAAKRVEPPVPEVLRVPLFGALIERMLDGGRWVIQDLGPAQSATIAFCNRFRCRLDIADLPADIPALNAEEDPKRLSALAKEIIPGQHSDTVNVVFCWDLLNYLQRPALTAIMDRVAERGRAGCLVHALIVYSATYMPTVPGRYAPWPDDTGESSHNDQLVYTPATLESCEAPRYTPDDLAHCLRGYRVERAVLLNNGMQEFLFRI